MVPAFTNTRDRYEFKYTQSFLPLIRYTYAFYVGLAAAIRRS